MNAYYLTKLLFRFGYPCRKNVIDRFGKGYVDGIEGWQFPREAIDAYNRAGKLLTMDLDIPCGCDLDCSYCFAKESAYYRPLAGDKPLSMQRIRGYLLEAKKLGLQSAKIIGYGEPFTNPKIFDFIEFASGHDIHLVIFTACYTLGEERFGGRKERVVDFLFRHKVSLMIKYHTLDRYQEARIVGKEWYPDRRDENLRLLLEHGGFASVTPTRLGLENVIATRNVQELAAIYEYFKIRRNVHVDIDPPIPVGRTATKEQSERVGLTEERLMELYERIYWINRRYGIPSHGVSPFIGNSPCSQLPNGLYLTLSGKVMSCCGGNEQYGDVNDGESVSEIFPRNPYRLKAKTVYHDCPYRERAGILSAAFLKRVRSELEGK
ncbi:MAG: radical SAM protein [Candidatus Moranbacteria bacterium]|nr:radical SAM protein [Candidatus Moranbacteria bacterium]